LDEEGSFALVRSLCSGSQAEKIPNTARGDCYVLASSLEAPRTLLVTLRMKVGQRGAAEIAGAVGPWVARPSFTAELRVGW